MATKLGDATIKIAIDPGLARQELERLSQEIEKIDKSRKDLQDRADKEEENREKTKEKKAKGQKQSFLDQLLGGYKVAADLLEQSSLLGTSIAEATKGTAFEAAGKKIEEALDALSKKVISLRSEIDVIAEVAQQTVQYNQAALALGGKFPDDETELIKQLHEIAAAQKGLTKDIEIETRKETLRLIFDGVKTALGGGK
jgi:uncharacterized protein YoxC